MIKKLNKDIPASIVVFLVALPLCLGIALASGAPLMSGLISGIIGGIVIGIISQSHTSVSGPAAGLAAVVLASLTALGNFNIFLLAVVIAGFIQLIIGIAKGGVIANYIPSNVIKGLLASIGIILILKQIPHAVAFDHDAFGEFEFKQLDHENTFSELRYIFTMFSWGAIIISGLSLLTLIFWQKTFMRKWQLLPSSLFVVLMGIAINNIFQFFIPELYLSTEHLVNIPKITSVDSFIRIPSFDAIFDYKVWQVGLTIAIVASIETLLNLEAVENIDPHKRVASPNRELVAQGVGNMLSGFIGGLPITSVIVRSSVNINSGAETKMSAILHGVLLFLSVLFLTSFLNEIPLASLAVILLVTGYKLAKVSIFKEEYKKGWNQFIPFVVTILAIVFTDLLIGIIIGSVVSIFFLLKSQLRNPFVLEKEQVYKGEIIKISLPNQVSFLSKGSIKETLWSIPEGSRVMIDAQSCDFIDNDVLEIIDDFQGTVSKEKNIQLNIIGIRKHYHLEDRVEFINVLDKETQQRLTPDEVLDMLKQGNERFLHGKWTEKYLRHQVNATAFGQNPFAAILSCIDSRTTVEHIFDLGLGDVFSIRIAGNILNEDILGSMEFAVHAIGVKLLVVLGHTNCGAIKGACANVKLGNLTGLLKKINPAIKIAKGTKKKVDNTHIDFVDKVAYHNVLVTIEQIKKKSKIIADLHKKGKVKIVGGMYNIDSGAVTFY